MSEYHSIGIFFILFSTWSLLSALQLLPEQYAIWGPLPYFNLIITVIASLVVMALGVLLMKPDTKEAKGE